jgi:hypothetical protein
MCISLPGSAHNQYVCVYLCRSTSWHDRCGFDRTATCPSYCTCRMRLSKCRNTLADYAGLVAHKVCTCTNGPPCAYVCDAVVYIHRVRGFILDRSIGVHRSFYRYTPNTSRPLYVSVIRTRAVDMCTSWWLHTYQHEVYYVYAVRMFIYVTYSCHAYCSCNVGINFVVAMSPLYDAS